MRIMLRNGLFALALILSGSLVAASDPVDELKKADEEFCRDFAARGVEGWLAHFAPDAVVFPRSGPVKQGAAEVRKHYEEAFAGEGFSLTWKPVGGSVAASRDLGYTYGVYELHTRDKEGKPAVRTGKYFTTWRKQKDGSWKVAADIGQPDTP